MDRKRGNDLHGIDLKPADDRKLNDGSDLYYLAVTDNKTTLSFLAVTFLRGISAKNERVVLFVDYCELVEAAAVVVATETLNASNALMIVSASARAATKSFCAVWIFE